MKALFSFLLVWISLGNFCANSQEYTPLKSANHYVFHLNTGDNLILGIPDYAWDEKPLAGDEIGVFNQAGQLVGSGVYDGTHMAIAVWGDDETTREKEGVLNGEKFSLRWWHKMNGQEDVLQVVSWLDGDDLYHSNGISVVNKFNVIPSSKTVKEYLLEPCVPNPVKETTRIGFSIPVKTTVDISVFTASGEFVTRLFAGEREAGTYSIDFNARDYAAGSYCYKMQTPEFSATRYMNLVR